MHYFIRCKHMQTWILNPDYSVACAAVPQFAPNIAFIVCVGISAHRGSTFNAT